jgi:Ca2+-binding RTX toxin-like protein
MNSPRSYRGGRFAAIAASAALLVAIGAAGAGADVNPGGGSNFDADEQGWQTTTAECRFGDSEASGFCEATGERVPEGGNPGGALRARTEVLANTAGLFTAQHVFRSPSFTLEEPFDAAFTYDRRFESGSLLSIGPRAEVSVVLVDDAGGAEALLLEDALGPEDAEYATRLVGVAPGILEAGATYHLEIRIATGSNSSQEDVVGTTDVLFDNVRLISSDRGTGGPGSGDGARPGVAPGGSVTLLRRCTMFGTEGDDRIVGTKRTDIICALGGDDVVKSKGGADVVDGANGDDTVRGAKKGDLLLGVKGRDRLIGSKGSDRVKGGDGRDVLKAGKHNDNISARDGERDLVDGGSGKRNRARTDGKDKVKRVQRLMPRKKK